VPKDHRITFRFPGIQPVVGSMHDLEEKLLLAPKELGGGLLCGVVL
jgi:hypothetical protein